MRLERLRVSLPRDSVREEQLPGE